MLTMDRVTCFSQDVWGHSNKIVSLFDWSGNTNLVGSCGLDNSLLLYDIRLSRPVFQQFVSAPSPNCLKTCDNKLVLAARGSDALVEVYDMRKLNVEYGKMVYDCFDMNSKKYLIKEMSKKFEQSDSLNNFSFGCGVDHFGHPPDSKNKVYTRVFTERTRENFFRLNTQIPQVITNDFDLDLRLFTKESLIAQGQFIENNLAINRKIVTQYNNLREQLQKKGLFQQSRMAHKPATASVRCLDFFGNGG